MEENTLKKKLHPLLSILKWILIIGFGIGLLPITIGGLILWFIYKKVPNKKLKIALSVFVAIPTLLIGSGWIYALNHPSSTITQEVKSTSIPSPAGVTESSTLPTSVKVEVLNSTPEPMETMSPTPTATPVKTPTPKPVTPKPATPKPTVYVAPTQYIAPTQKPIVNSGGTYGCDCSKTCTQITSCAEAQYQLNVCGCSARDADKDGTACDGAPLHCQN